ncbi:MerR family transcriptional regulator [Pseudomonas cavernicola]|uniref:MerR family transcriptional regulator n=1 Tax=Pseudomonas cavernicola TaxID=2320866 RepID=A0A418XDN0_9PSED|nr:MerR family transcriptional regulator [Pseudomonas cavernicola]RJG10629.1 MerR family transcriptional regulator [Pseudomonas cavernicola]
MKNVPSLLQRLLLQTPVTAELEPAAEYTVDELAREAGTTVRNLRAYQDRGLLPPPQRRGRVGIYSAEHLARLKLIGELLERGYSIASIRELLEAWQQGQGLAQVLGLDQAIIGPWNQEEPGSLGFDELQALFGTALDDGMIDRAQALGLLEFAGDHLRVPSPRLFAAGVQLFQAGIPLPVLLDELAAIRANVEQVSAGIVRMIVQHLVNPLLANSLPRAEELERLSAQLLQLRPLVEQVVETELARGLQLSANRELGERVGELLKGFLKP